MGTIHDPLAPPLTARNPGGVGGPGGVGRSRFLGVSSSGDEQLPDDVTGQRSPGESGKGGGG